LVHIKNTGISCGLITMAALTPSAHAQLAATNSLAVAAPAQTLQKPAWLTDLSLGVRESYDNNILLVSGNGMQPQYSWITTISARVGFDSASSHHFPSPRGPNSMITVREKADNKFDKTNKTHLREREWDICSTNHDTVRPSRMELYASCQIF
jgi:hypothetical protein